MKILTDEETANEILDYIELRLPLIPALKPHLKEIEGLIKKMRARDINPLIPNPDAWLINYLFPAKHICNEAVKDVGRKHEELLNVFRGGLGKDYEVPLDEAERQKQKGKPWYARDLKDFNDLKYVHIYDRTNNKIPGRTKKNVSQSTASKTLRLMMDNERSGYRAGLEKKKGKKKDPKRYQR